MVNEIHFLCFLYFSVAVFFLMSSFLILHMISKLQALWACSLFKQWLIKPKLHHHNHSFSLIFLRLILPLTMKQQALFTFHNILTAIKFDDKNFSNWKTQNPKNPKKPWFGTLCFGRPTKTNTQWWQANPSKTWKNKMKC